MLVNNDPGKVAKLSHEHKSTYVGNKNLKQNVGSKPQKDHIRDELPVVLDED
ncbi:hypothetical protein JOC86_002098 [Bacillus pakistanensis]|uniref:Uncharacterized protein n=2 Tax=Rossellomorea pakistanensis TaxID=992288 RepID=A0ABS2NCG7_9BACI|nr:hypothetical protein [Bacillus pakistanensis]